MPCISYKACALLSLLYVYYDFCVGNKNLKNKQTNMHMHTCMYICIYVYSDMKIWQKKLISIFSYLLFISKNIIVHKSD